MGLVRLAALCAIGYAGYKYFENTQEAKHPAFAPGQGGGQNFAQIRDAGPQAMADPPHHKWTAEDQMSDESFPASDPPGSY